MKQVSLFSSIPFFMGHHNFITILLSLCIPFPSVFSVLSSQVFFFCVFPSKVIILRNVHIFLLLHYHFFINRQPNYLKAALCMMTTRMIIMVFYSLFFFMFDIQNLVLFFCIFRNFPIPHTLRGIEARHDVQVHIILLFCKASG